VGLRPGQSVTFEIESKDQAKQSIPLKLRINKAIQIDYYQHGGILPFVLWQLLTKR
jgi:aconitate hydratase